MRSSVRLGLGIVTGRRIGGSESDEIDEDPAGKETHGPQVVENVAVDEAVHNAVHHTALPRFQRPENNQYHRVNIGIAMIRIRIRRIQMFFGLPDPLVTSTDPDADAGPAPDQKAMEWTEIMVAK